MIKFIACTLTCLMSMAAIFGFFEQPSPAASIARGKKVYETYCLACHHHWPRGATRNLAAKMLKERRQLVSPLVITKPA